jgi:hypothetical protein
VQGYNPFQPPSATGGAPRAQASSAPLTAIVEAFRQTKPWVTFLSVLGYIGAGFMVLAGLITMASGALAGAAASGPLGAFAPLLGLFYIAFGGLYVVPATLLWRYGASISTFVETGDLERMVEPVVRQKSFWRFAGIMTIVMLIGYVVVILGAIVVGVSSGLSR